MAKLRHVAYRVDDMEGMAQFFVDALGMEVAQKRGDVAIDLTDGTINITLLSSNLGGTHRTGIDHIGFTVEDEDAQRESLLAAGAKELNPINPGQVYYELKFEGPEGIVVDLGHWAGTAPVTEEAAAEAR
jgi:catechol 2,3-dioxygenase-like lactoylglutathione lyase family enzyme